MAVAFEVYAVGAARLWIARKPRGGDWLLDDIGALKDAGVGVLVSLLTAEEVRDLDLVEESDCCKRLGAEFISVPIPDFGVPSDSSSFMTAVEDVVRHLEAGTSVAVHCRQSIGRSGLLVCGVLLRLGVSLEQAVATASAARGVTVPESPDQRRWLEANAHVLRSHSSSA